MRKDLATVRTMDADHEVRAEPVVDLELPSVLESVSYARDLVACRLPGSMRKHVELVVSELVTNAIKHGSGPIGLRVDVDEHHVRVAVSDATPSMPARTGDGFGLHIVERLASGIGIDADGAGKTVWAELRRT
jgi:signal transduction histidine kinase